MRRRGYTGGFRAWRDGTTAHTTRLVAYRHGDIALTGVLNWDDAVREQRPGILLVHGGGGLDDHARTQARRYAAAGYVVLACDMYGDGVVGDRERVITRITELRNDPDLLVQRARAGLEALADCPECGERRAAVGFCFGGMTVLTLARSGADLVGVVSMHGSLATVRPAERGAVRARVLVCHGASDPHVPLADVVAFAGEMTQAGADWQLIMYGGAVHGFTHANAVPGSSPGVEYDAVTDKRSFAAATAFLAAAFSGAT